MFSFVSCLFVVSHLRVWCAHCVHRCTPFQVVYHGSRTALPSYLRELGFHVPNEHRETVADIVEVDADAKVKAAAKAASGKNEAKPDGVDMDMADFLSELLFLPHKGLPVHGLRENDKCPPLTTAELVAEWKANPLYKQQMGIQDAPLELATDFAKAQYGVCFVESFS